MLKQPSGSSTNMCVPDDRPRKKLSFRDPEVDPRNPAHAHPHPNALPAQSALHHPRGQQRAGISRSRPHSISGIVGLSGLSSSGGQTYGSPSGGSYVSTGVLGGGQSYDGVVGVTSMLSNPGLLTSPIIPPTNTHLDTHPTHIESNPTHINSNPTQIVTSQSQTLTSFTHSAIVHSNSNNSHPQSSNSHAQNPHSHAQNPHSHAQNPHSHVPLSHSHSTLSHSHSILSPSHSPLSHSHSPLSHSHSHLSPSHSPLSPSHTHLSPSHSPLSPSHTHLSPSHAHSISHAAMSSSQALSSPSNEPLSRSHEHLSASHAHTPVNSSAHTVTSPTHTPASTTHTPLSASVPVPGRQNSPPSSKAAVSQPATRPSPPPTAPQHAHNPPQHYAPQTSTQSNATKSGSVTQKTSSAPTPEADTLNMSAGKQIKSGGHHHHHQQHQQSGGKNLPPSSLPKAVPPHVKPAKPASRSSSFKKQRNSPVQQAVTFLTEHGIVNGRSRPHPHPNPPQHRADTHGHRESHRDSPQRHPNPTAVAPSMEDIDLESQAMRVVRTVGQAFEVCHKISVKDTPPSPEPQDDHTSDHGSDVSTDKLRKDLLDTESTQEDLVTLTPSDSVNEDSVEHLTQQQRPNKLEPLAPPAGSDILIKGVGETYTSPLSEQLPSGDSLPMAGTPLSVHHEIQLLREQLEQQQQQTQAAVSQVHLLRDQLAAETAARLEAQARTHQLLVHNKELLEHIQALVLQVRDLELKLAGGSQSHLLPSLPDLKTPLLVTEASPGHSSQLAAALDLGGTASLLFQSLPDHSPATPSPTRAHTTFRFPSPSSPTSTSSASLPGGLQPPGVSSHSTSTSPHSRDPSPRAASMGPLIHPLPVWGSESSAREVTLAVPRQEQIPQGVRQQQQIQQQQMQQQQQQQQSAKPRPGQRYDECSSTPSLSSESDPKRDSSGQSSGESVMQAVAQLYALEPHRLAQVPEDAVTLGPYGPTPLGAPRNINGPITRTASERVSRETLAQLQRMAWARHTTK